MASLFTLASRVSWRVLARIWILALAVVIGGTAGYVYSRVAPPSYTARAYVVVVAADPGDATAAVNFAQAYARIAGQGDVLTLAVAAAPGTTVDELTKDVRAASSPDAPMIEVSASATSGQRAALMANAVANGLIATAAKQTATTRMSLSVLSAAIPPTDVTSPPRPRIGAAIGAGAGLLLGILAMLAGADRAFGVRRSRRTARPTAPSGPEQVPAIAARVTGDPPVLPVPARGQRDDAESTW